MSKSVIINLGGGSLQHGFPRVTVQLWSADSARPEQFMGALPPAPNLVELYRNWQLVYRGLCDRIPNRHPQPGYRKWPEPIVNQPANQPASQVLSLVAADSSAQTLVRPPKVNTLEVSEAGITHVSQVDFDELCQQLQSEINHWLKSEAFLPVEYRLRSRLAPDDWVRIIFETEDPWLRRLPWHRWDFFRDYPKSEMVLSQLEYQRRNRTPANRPKDRSEVRILAVFGNSHGIDLEMEARLLQQLPNAAVKLLVNPSRTAFNEQLWRPEGWDILFFAGHSQTQSETGRLYINEDPTGDSITLPQLEEALKAAIERGLQLAIFNSCDGLGLARDLEKLHIPTVMVMREPVPNRVAQVFFNQFLLAFSQENLPLYLAFQRARRQLQGLENDFPAASWLPVVCQNLAADPPTWQSLGGITPCPYRGLSAFKEEDAPLFFGREQFTEELAIAAQIKPFVAVVGPSGSGKSSVVFAGLVPRLRQVSDDARQIISFRPGNAPSEALAEALDSASNPTILIIDQFEELYTLSSIAEQQQFLDRLVAAIQSMPNFTLVITLRADFYGHALSYRSFGNLLQGAVHNLCPMSREELYTAIEQPAARASVKLEAGLSSRLTDDVWQQVGGLPLLEFALTQLWAKQENGLLTHRAYSEIGGVAVALANHAETVYSQLSPEDKQRAQRVFMQLVHLREEQEPARRLASRDELKEENWSLVATLASARLVVTNYSVLTGQETVEIVHETLLRSWERLAQWIRSDGDFRRWQHPLRIARRQWEQEDCDKDRLLRGKPLVDAEHWYRERQQDLSPGSIRYIQQSLKLRDRENNKHLHRRRLTFCGLAGGLVMALLLTGTAIHQWRQAHIREIEATSQYSEALFASNQKLEALVEAIRARRGLIGLFGADKTTQKMVDLSLRQAAYGLVEYNRLSGHADGVRSVAYSHDGQTLASIPENSSIMIWDKNGELRTTIPRQGSRVNQVAFSPDDQTLVSVANDGTLRLWSLAGELLKTIQGHDDEVINVAFSPDGQTIASASRDRTIRLWNPDGTLLKTLKGHQAEVTDIAFSPDGQMIASASGDRTIRLWNLDGKLMKTMTGHQAEVTGVAFSLDSRAIASSANDRTVKLWAIDGTLQQTFTDHRAEVTDVAFSPDGQTIASTSADRTVKLWRDNGTLLASLEGHGDIAWQVAFSPDGETLASASWDATVRLWRYKNPLLTVLAGHEDGITSAAFSQKGDKVVSASDDRTVKLWDVDGTLLKTFRGHQGRVYTAAFSPDGQTIASGADDNTIKLWNLEGKLLNTLTGHSAAIWGIEFSPDGQTIASASDDETIRLWNLEGKLLKTLTSHQGRVYKAMFTPDGRTIVSVSNDKTIRLWNLDGSLQRTIAESNKITRGTDLSTDGQRIALTFYDGSIAILDLESNVQQSIEVSSNEVKDLVFSPDGQTIASALADDTIQLWDVDGTPIKTLKRHNEAIWGVDYSSDGQRIASASADSTVILWNLDRLLSLDELAYACDQVRDYLTYSDEVSAGDRQLCDL